MIDTLIALTLIAKLFHDLEGEPKKAHDREMKQRVYSQLVFVFVIDQLHNPILPPRSDRLLVQACTISGCVN